MYTIKKLKKELGEIIECDLLWKREKFAGDLEYRWVGRCKRGCPGYVAVRRGDYLWRDGSIMHGWGIFKYKANRRYSGSIKEAIVPYKCLGLKRERERTIKLKRKRTYLLSVYNKKGIGAVLDIVCK